MCDHRIMKGANTSAPQTKGEVREDAVNKMEEQQIIGEARVEMHARLQKIFDNLDLDDLESIAEEALLKAGRLDDVVDAVLGSTLVGDTDEEGPFRVWDERIQEFVDEVKASFFVDQVNPVYGVVRLGDGGLELEFFDQEPKTPGFGGDRNNWPGWFRVYEGNLRGGDSICIDRKGPWI